MKILYNKKSRTALKEGVDAVADAVKVTLGPFGKNVIIANKFEDPIITKDGVSIARNIYLNDNIRAVGANMIKQASIATNDKVGDGTTTSMVLAQIALEEGFNKIEAGDSAIQVAKYLKEELPNIISRLKKKALPIKGKEDIYNVAMISTNNDERLSSLITNAYEKVEDNIIYENNTSADTILEVLEGMRFKSTYHSTYFITDKTTNSITLKDGRLAIYNSKIHNVRDVKNIITKASQDNKPLVIIADDIDPNVIISIISSNKKKEFQCVVISSPGFGHGRQKTLEDISIYTGAEIYKKDPSDPVLGKFDSVHIDEKGTTITGSYGDKEEIEKHINHLELILNNKDNEEEKKITKKRIAKFKKGVGIIKIGANSQLELKERKDRLEDAINSVKASVEGGIIAGGGISLFIESFLYEGSSIYKKILVSPYNQIFENSGLLKDDKKIGQEYFEKYIKQGIVDPVLVTITALENAISVVSTILTTECMVVWEEE